MRRIVLTVLALAGAAACERVDVDFNGGATENVSVLAVAVEYPDGYDWRKDSLGEESKASLVLYRDWERMLSVDVGPGAAYPDMHRIVDGSLFTDYSTSDQTVIGRDGVELFRYEGRESIKDIFVSDTAVFTLGVSRNGGGFSFRNNGRVVMSQSNGQLLSGLEADGDRVCFAYKVPIGSGIGEDNAAYRFYIVCDGVQQQVVPPADMKMLTSMRLWNSEVNYVGYSSAASGMVWQAGQKTHILTMGQGQSLVACSLMEMGKKLYTHAYYKTSLSDVRSSLWKGDTLKFSSGEYGSIYAVCKDEECFALTSGGRAFPVFVVIGNRLDTIPPNLAMFSPDAIACNRNGYYLGLNDRQENYAPVVMHGRDTVRFGFNGYFSCFSSR